MSDDGQPNNAVPFARPPSPGGPAPLDLGREFAAPPGFGGPIAAGFGATFASEDDIMSQVGAQLDEVEEEEEPEAPARTAPTRHPDDPVRMPAWPYFTPGAEAVMVERGTDTGFRENWNTFPLEASIEQVLERTKLAGTYYITPMSGTGEPLVLPKDAYRIVIPEGFPYLVALRERAADAGLPTFGSPGASPYGNPGFYPGFAPPPMGGGMDAAVPFLQVLEARDQRALQERAMIDGATRAREAQLRQAELDLQRQNREAADLAANRTAMLMDTAMQKSIATAEAGHKASLEMLKGGYEGIATLQQNTVQAERNRLDAAQAAAESAAERRERAYREDMERRDRLAREERDRRDAFEREEKQRRDAREREDREAREKRDREDREARDRAAIAERERDREFRAEMAKLQAAQSPLAMVTALAGILPPVVKAVSDAGIDLGGILENFTGGGAKGTMEVIGDVLIEGLRTLQGAGPRPGAPQEIEEVEELVDGQGRILEQRVIRRGPPGSAPVQAPRQIAPSMPAMAPGQQAPQPVPAGTGMAQPPPVQAPPPPAPFAPEGFAAPPPFAAGPAAPAVAGPPGAAVPSGPMLDGPTKSRARRAILAMVDQLQGLDPSTWLPALMVHMGSPDAGAVGAYLRAFTIRTALLEAGAAPQLVETFIQLLDTNGLVPDVPRG